MNIPPSHLNPRPLPTAAAAHVAPVSQKHTAFSSSSATVTISPEAHRAAAGHPTPAPVVGRGPHNIIWGNSPKK